MAIYNRFFRKEQKQVPLGGRDGLPSGQPLRRWGRILSFDLLDVIG